MRDKLEISIERDFQVAKANELIQNAINNYNLTELKAFCYILSKVKPTDQTGQEYKFKINDFCEVCGIETNNGQNYQRVKKALKGLADKSYWQITENGSEKLIRAIDDPEVHRGSGTIKVKLHHSIEPYVLNLQGQYTQYSLLGVCPMRSAYSIKLYELLKSYTGLHRKTFDLEDLKQRLQAPYSRYKDFRVKAIEVAVREINLYTDIEITWEPIKIGRSVAKISFEIKKRDSLAIWTAGRNAIDTLDGQLRLNMDGTITEERGKKWQQ